MAQDNDDEKAQRESEEHGADVARRFMEAQTRRAAEQKTKADEANRKREAEEQERRERERSMEAEKQNRRREEDERLRLLQEEEARQLRSEEARRHEDEQAREREEARKAREAAAAAALREARTKEAAALLRKEVGTRARASEPYRAPSRSRRIVAVLFLLLFGGLAAVHFMPLDARSFEKAAAAHFGTPVKIGSAHFATLPVPALRFERVDIGAEGDVTIATVTMKAGLSTLLDERKNFKSIELEGAKVPASWLAAAIWGKARGDTLRVERVIARGVALRGEGLELPPVDVDARFGAEGGLQSFRAQTADGTQAFEIAMKDGHGTVELSAKPFRLPFAGMVQFDDLIGSGTLTRSELILSKFEARALDGSFRGSARLRWGAHWRLEGEFVARSMDPARVAATLVPTGRLEGTGTFSMHAASPGELQHTARLDSTFTVHRGTLGFVDLTRLLQGSGARGGTTSFSRMDGAASFTGGYVQVRRVRVAAGLLNATGEAGVDPQKNLNGRVQVDMASRSRAVLSLAGTVAAPQIKR